MLIPAHHIAILAALYAAEYFWRAWQLKDRRYMYIGKAVGRLILTVVYLWFALFPAEAEIRSVWIRWSLFMFLAIDLLFVAQDHIMRRVIHAEHS
jgi:hypothetical protein